MIPGIKNNISALDALGKQMGVTANNIANADSEGFKKSRGVITEGQNNSVEIEISKVESPGPIVSEMIEGEPVEKEMSNVDLTEEIPKTIPTQRNYEANIKAIQTRDEMLGSILDIIG
jgi:flagellar hook protein FlgE